jgi:GNAT superfamily N-acetyltransferase
VASRVQARGARADGAGLRNAAVRVALAAPRGAHHEAASAAGLVSAHIRLSASEEDLRAAFAVMLELRPMLRDADDFVARVQAQQVEGYQIAILEDDGQVCAVAGFRVQKILVSGLTLYVDDLVTGVSFRSRGYGKTMLDWLIAYARQRGCETFSLDSGTQRHEAHAFYFREGMRVTSFHFALSLK